MIHDFATDLRKTSWRDEAVDQGGAATVAAPRVLRSNSLWLGGLFLALLFVVLGYFLREQQVAKEPVLASRVPVVLSKQHRKKPVTKQKAASKNLAITKRSKTKISDPAVTNRPFYGFYESLSADSWPVPIHRGTYVSADANKRRVVYELQAASFRKRLDAIRLQRKLAQLKLPVSVSESVSAKGEHWYRVKLGPFRNLSKLNKAEDTLVSMQMMPLKKRVF